MKPTTNKKIEDIRKDITDLIAEIYTIKDRLVLAKSMSKMPKHAQNCPLKFLVRFQRLSAFCPMPRMPQLYNN